LLRALCLRNTSVTWTTRISAIPVKAPDETARYEGSCSSHLDHLFAQVAVDGVLCVNSSEEPLWLQSRSSSARCFTHRFRRTAPIRRMAISRHNRFPSRRSSHRRTVKGPKMLTQAKLAILPAHVAEEKRLSSEIGLFHSSTERPAWSIAARHLACGQKALSK